MNIKTKLLEDYVDFVDSTKNRIKFFKILFYSLLIYLCLYVFLFKNIFSLQQTSQTGDLDSKLRSRQYKFDLVASFMEKKSINPKLKQSDSAKEIGCSSRTLKGYRQDISKRSADRMPPSNTSKKNERFQIVNMISEHLK